MINIKEFFAEINNNISVESNKVISDLSISQSIEPNHRYGAWYGDADSKVNGKNYKVSLRIPNSVIETADQEYGELSNSTYNVIISDAEINAYGKLAITAQHLEKIGVSDKNVFYNNLLKYAKKKGYLTRKKRPLPKVVKSILCITSAGSNIKEDIINTTGLPEGKIKVLNIGSSKKIAQVILANKYADIVVLYRGGHEDVAMNMFSEELVLDAIHKSKFPVCVALGHDNDRPFVYEVADQSFSTPSSFGKSINAHNQGVVYDARLKKAKKGKLALWSVLAILVILLIQMKFPGLLSDVIAFAF